MVHAVAVEQVGAEFGCGIGMPGGVERVVPTPEAVLVRVVGGARRVGGIDRLPAASATARLATLSNASRASTSRARRRAGMPAGYFGA